MKIGLTSADYNRIPIHYVLRLLNWSGVTFSEVTTHVLSHPLKSIQAVRGMDLGLHLPNWGNCGYDFSTRKAESRIERDLQRLNTFASRFRFHYAVFHPPEKNPSEENWTYLMDNVRRVPVPLILENMRGWSPQKFMNRFKQCKDILGPALSGICLDIPHAFLSGHQWQDFYEIAQEEIQVVHLSDCSPEQDLHLPFNMGGELSLEDILRELKKLKYNRIINFELKPSSPRHLHTYFQTLTTATTIFETPSSCPNPDRVKWLVKAGRLLDIFLPA